MTTATDITTLQRHQTNEAADVLARAFFDDPLTMYIVPDESQRRRALPWFFGRGANYGQLYGEVHTTPSTVEGAAVWLPPGETIMTPFRMLRAGLFAAPLRLGLSSMGRFFAVMNHLEELHKRDVPPEHWYLMILGVDPPRQGQGVGGTIIQPILARADEAGLPCYLETMKTRNVPFYQKHGFEVVVEDDLPKGGPHFWTMRRAPRS